MSSPERPRYRRRLAAGVALAIPVAIGLAAFAGWSYVPVHGDGGGSLGSTGEANAWWTFAVAESEQDEPVSFGIPLCARDAGTAPVITRISATRTLGVVPVLLGAAIRTFRPSDDNLPMIGSPGYPPAVPDPLADGVGYAVSTPCASPADDAYTELVIGLQPEPGAGGGWTGERIEYTVGGQRHALELEYRFLFCGPAISVDACSPVPGQDGPAASPGAG